MNDEQKVIQRAIVTLARVQTYLDAPRQITRTMGSANTDQLYEHELEEGRHLTTVVSKLVLDVCIMCEAIEILLSDLENLVERND